MQKKLTKKRFILGYLAVTLLLALVRVVFPDVARSHPAPATEQATQEANTVPVTAVSTPAIKAPTTAEKATISKPAKKHPIYSVPNFADCFPDTNAVQLVAAQQWGVTPVKDRIDAEARKKELVYIGASPYYHVDPLYQSIPYLVPRAALLLHDIGQAFFDSLYVKGIPLHRFIVTSVLRSQQDVVKLRRFNGNATENSCHLYGTTFDICYNRYETVESPKGPRRRRVRDDSLKYVLSEVLRDMRQQGRCYIKYERKQGCFHMTVR